MSNEEVIFNEKSRVKTMSETDKKCPFCGATMDFDPETGGLACAYCGGKQSIPTADGKDGEAAELDFDSAEKTGSRDWGAAKKTVECKSCGAVSVYDALQISDVCPYCGSNQVMETHDESTLAPGGVVTFAITLAEAAERFTKWIKGKLFCPSKAKKMAKPDAFKGVYMPYWTFDTETVSEYTAKYGKDRTVKDKDGNEKTVTDWYNTSDRYEKMFDDWLERGFKPDDEAIYDRVEPFQTAQNKQYQPEYVAGFVSERYSIGLKDAFDNAKERIEGDLRSTIESVIRGNYNADRVKDLVVKTKFSKVTYKYLLLPLWLSSFKYNEKLYQFMVNGQTGQVGGRAPVSPLRVIIAILIGIAVIAGIAVLANYLS